MFSQEGTRGDDGKWQARQVDLTEEPDFQVYAVKDDCSTVSHEVRVENADVFPIGVACEPTEDLTSVGDVMTLPVGLGYACKVHKGQGLTIPYVYAILEGLFAHGQ